MVVIIVVYLSMIEEKEDKNKFELLYNSYKNLMLNRAYEILKDKSLAEDAVQEAFLRIIKNIKRIEIDNSHKTKGYVVVVVENVAKTMYVKEKKVIPIEFERPQEGVCFEEMIENKIEAEYVASKIEMLKPIYRDILVLKYINEFNDKEIALALGISNSNARKRLQRARESLQKLLERGE